MPFFRPLPCLERGLTGVAGDRLEMGCLTTMMDCSRPSPRPAGSVLAAASDVLDGRSARTGLTGSNRYGARTSRHTRAQQSRCTRPACAPSRTGASPLVCCIAHCHAKPKSDSTSRQCKVPFSTCQPPLAQSSATLLSSPPSCILDRADARRLCPRRLDESDVAHYCFESGCGAALG